MPTNPILDRRLLLSRFGNFTPNQNAPIQNIPMQVPSEPLIPSFEEVGQDSKIEPLESDVLAAQSMSKQKSGKLTGGSIDRSLSEVSSNRFDNFLPGDYDNEDAYAQGQSFGAKMVNGVGKGLALTGTTFLQSTAGLVNGVFQAIGDGRAASFFDNDFNRGLDELNKQLEDSLPNYRTKVERDAKWYSPDYLLTGNFLWDDIVKNMGFAAGAALSANVFAMGLKGLSTLPYASRLFSVGKAAETIAATEEALLASNKGVEMYGKIKSLSDKFLGQYNVLNKGQKAVVAGLSTTGEAGFEAFHNLNEFRDGLIEKYKIEHDGRGPSGKDLEDINIQADNVGKTSFMLNTALLTATNYIQFEKILGSSAKIEKGIIDKEINNIIKKGNKYAEGGISNKVLSSLNKVRPYTFSVPEGFEEGSQYAIGVGTKDYYNKAYNQDSTDWLESVMYGITETVGTNEGMKNVLIGGLSGSLMTARGRFKQNTEKSKNTADAIAKFNKYELSDFTKATADSVNRGVELQKEREEALRQGDILTSKDKEADYIINYLTPRIKYGRFDLVLSDINDAKNQARSDEGFSQLQADGKALATDTKESYLKRLQNLENTANNIKSLYESLQLRYASRIDNSGKPIYDNKVMDMLIYSATKVADYDNRIPEVSSELLSAGIDISNIQTNLPEVIAKIKSLNSTKEDSLIEYANDLSKLHEKRKFHLEEYNDIKNNPTKYQEEKELQAPQIKQEDLGKKIIVKDEEDNDFELEIGEKYFAEKQISVKETDKPIKKYSTFTVVGKDDNGNIIVALPDNKQISVKPENLGKYRLGKSSDVKTSNAKTFVAASGRVFKYNKGKGNTIEGSIGYRSGDDSLWFESFDGKDVIRITREDLIPQVNKKTGKKYDVAKVYTTGKFTESEQEEINKEVPLSEKLATRNKIIVDLYNENKTELEKTNKALEERSNKLKDLKERIEKAPFTKKGQFRKDQNTVKKVIDELVKEKQAVEKEIEQLSLKKEGLDELLPYLQDLVDNVRELPQEGKELLNQLKEDVDNVKSLIDSTQNSIDKNISLLASIEDALKSAFKLLSKMLADFKIKNPNIPSNVDDLQSQVERFLGEKGAEEYIAQKLGFTETVLEFQEFISEQETKTTDLSKQSQDLLSKIENLQKDLEDLKKEQIAKQKVLDKFEEVAEKWRKEQVEAEALKRNQQLRQEALGTADPGLQTRKLENNYEPESKKSNLIIVSSSKSTDSEAPHHVRANKFGINFNKFKNKHKVKGVLVTSKNEKELGLEGLTKFLVNQSDATEAEKAKIDPDKTIVMVMVQEVPGGKPIPVDENGEPLTEPSLLNAIFQVMPDESLTWSKKYGGGSMFRKGTSQEVIDYYVKQYNEWRNSIISNSSLSTFDIQPSFGRPQYNPILDENGNPKKDEKGNLLRDYNAITTISEAGLLSEEEIVNGGPFVFIPTTNTELNKGSLTFESPLGRPLLSLPGAYVPLKNRKFTKQEGETIHKALYHLANSIVKNGKINGNEEADRIISWLRTIVYWGTPKNAAGHNSIFWEYTQDGNMVLKFSGKDVFNVSFTPASIEQNKEKILAVLEGMYNNINSGRTDKTTGDNAWNLPYYEIIDFKEDGSPIYRKVKDKNGEEQDYWPNYQTYLLSGKNRKKEEIPLTTNLRPLNNKEDVNRKGVYFTIKTGLPAYTEPVPVTVTKLTPVTPGQPVPQPKVEPQPKKEEPKVEGFVLDGKTENTLVLKGDLGTLTFIIDESSYNPTEGTINITKVAPLDKATNDKLLAKFGSEEKVEQIIKSTVASKAIEQIKGKQTPVVKQEEEPVKKEETKPVLETETSVIEKTELTPAEKLRRAKEKIKGTESSDKQSNQPTKGRQPKNNARIALLKRFEKFKSENWTEAEKWLKANFPNVPVYRVKNALINSNGQQLWGMLQDGAIYVYENAEVGTIYHEVFEAVWKMFSDPIEQTAVINEFRNRQGSFVDRPTGQVVKYKDATPFQIKEQLAEEFRDYVLYKKAPVKPKDGRPWIIKLFSELINSIKELFLGKESTTKVGQMFKKIGTGYHKTYSPYTTQLSLVKTGVLNVDDVPVSDDADARINISPDTVNDMMQHMTYTALQRLIKGNESIFNVEKINKEKLYKELRENLENTILISTNQAQIAVDENLITKEEQETIDQANLDLLNKIDQEWEQIQKKHEEFLRGYSLQFDENNELSLNEEKGKEDPYGDATKIDNFKKANSAVKLLLSTIPYMDNNGQYVESSINGVKLMPVSQVFISVMNNVYTSRNIDEMLDRIKKMAENDKNYQTLYYNLTLGFEDISQIEEIHDAQMLSAFWRTFKKQQPDVKNVYIFENADIEVGDSNMATAINQQVAEMSESLTQSIKNGNKYFTYSLKDNSFIGKKDEVKSIKAGTLPEKIAFLKDLGIIFNYEDIIKLDDEVLKTFTGAVDGIVKSLKQREKIVTVSNKVLDIKGQLKALSAVKVAIENPEFESTFFNVKGERTQIFIGTNAASDLFDAISQISNLNELKGTQYEYLLTDSFAKNSTVLGTMFDLETGEKRYGAPVLFKPAYADGTIDQQKGKKKQTSKLSYKERLVQEINMNLKGFYYSLVPGDASIQWMSYLGNRVSPETLRNGFSFSNSIFKGYFTSEVELSRENRPIVKDRNNKDLRFFKSILEDSKKDEVLTDDEKNLLHDTIVANFNNKILKKLSAKEKAKIEENLSLSPEELYVKYKDQINERLEKYITRDAYRTKHLLEEYGIVNQEENGYSVENLEFATENLQEDTLIRNLTSLSVNFMISNIEFHKLLYSDPYQYEDELKRIKNFNSPRQAIINSSPKMNVLLNKIWNRGFEGLGTTDFKRDYFRTFTASDVVSKYFLPNYDSFKETDGAGIISFKSYRNFRIRAGEWNDNEEKQYRYDTAFEKRDRKSELTSYEQELLKEGDPHIKSAYTPIKPIVSGNKGNGKSYNDIVLDKFALYPISYKTMKEIGNDINALKLHEKMQKEDIDYVIFKSGRKVGGNNTLDLYTTEGEFNTEPLSKNDIVNIPFSTMSIQAEVPSKDDNLVTRGSQVTKLVTLDYMEAGVPIDFMPGEDFTKRYKAWNELKDKNDYKVEEGQTPLYTLIQENKKLLEKATEAAYESLLNRMGIVEDKENLTFKVVSLEKTAKILRESILSREVNDNVSDALEGFVNGEVVIEATPAYQQIRNILYSIADKEVISPKINGGQKVQIPSTLFESGVRKTENGKLISDNLKFYEDENGKRICEIMIGRWFNSNLSDTELLNYLNKTEEGKNILSGIGFRIPTQKQNSIDAFVVKQFLPREMGDSVVIPSALVNKAGSDFDIDKLSIYLKNIYKDAKGNIKLIPFYGYGQKAKDKLKQLFLDVQEKKVEVISGKEEKQQYIKNIFGDSAWGLANNKTLAKWTPKFMSWFDDLLVDGKLPSQEIEQLFINRIQSYNKALEKLTDKELQNALAEVKAELWYKKSLENAYIDSMTKLVTHPMNFANLTKPNSAKQLEKLAGDITKALGFEEFDYSSVGNMMNRHFMSGLRHAFVSGKYAIGIAAVNQTNHSLNQRQPIYIDPSKFNKLSKEDRDWLTGGTGRIEDIYPKFKHINKINVDGKMLPTFSMIKSAVKNGDSISDIISQFIDGYVDISKGPWIMELGATPNVASTWLTLVKLGIPIEEVAYFMNQPIIKDYLQSIEKDGYSWLFMDQYVESVKDNKKYTYEGEIEIVKEIPSLNQLKKIIGKKEFSVQERAEQHFILDEFLKAAKLAEQMFHVTQGSNFDTATFNDPLLLFKKNEQYKKGQNTIISSIDKLVNNSFLETLKNKVYDIRGAFGEILPPEKGRVRDIVERTLLPYVDMPDMDFLKVAQKAVGDLFDYALQTGDEQYNNYISSILLGDKNTASEVNKFVKDILDDNRKEGQHPLFNNQVIRSLSISSAKKAFDPSGPNQVNVISIKNKDNKVYDQNQLIYAFQELRDYLGKDNVLYDKIIKSAILQSGLSRSPISFTAMLPYEDFVKIYNKTLSNLETFANLETFNVINAFQRENWNNEDVVPFQKAKRTMFGGYNLQMKFGESITKDMMSSKLPRLLKISQKSGLSDSDVVVYSWELFEQLLTDEDKKNNVSVKEKKAKMRKEGDYSFIKKGLFKKVYFNGQPLLSGKKQEFVYKMINAWGDSRFVDGKYYSAKEFYNVPRPSVIDNGFEPVPFEVIDNNLIASYFTTETPKNTQQGTDQLPECH